MGQGPQGIYRNYCRCVAPEDVQRQAARDAAAYEAMRRNHYQAALLRGREEDSDESQLRAA